MTTISFDDAQARRLYHLARSRAKSSAAKKTIKIIFERAARIDGQNSLSQAEAARALEILDKYDQASRGRLKIYDQAEVNDARIDINVLEATHRLFRQCYVYTDGKLTIQPARLLTLQTFVNEARRGEAWGQDTQKIAGLVNPKLDPADLLLLFEYLYAPTPQDKARQLTRLWDRFDKRVRTEVEAYDGWVDDDNSNAAKHLDALRQALRAVIDLPSEETAGYLSRQYLSICLPYWKTLQDDGFLSQAVGDFDAKKRLLGELAECFGWETLSDDMRKQLGARLQSSKETFFDILEDARHDINRYPPGSAEKIGAYHRIRLLYALAEWGGLTTLWSPERYFSLLFPGIDLAKDLPLLSVLPAVWENRYAIDNYFYGQGVLQAVERKAVDYCRARDAFFAQPDAARKQVYVSTQALLMYYVDFAQKLGCTREDIETKLQAGGVYASPKEVAGDLLVEVAAWHAARVLPSSLPEDVKAILQDLGIWEMIGTDVKEIILTDNINDGLKGIRDGEVELIGQAYDALGIIWLDVVDEDGEPRCCWEIVADLIHEWLHVQYYNKYFGDPERMRATPDERAAFLGEARYLRTYLQKVLTTHRNAWEEYQKLSAAQQLPEGDVQRLAELKGGIAGEIFAIADEILYIERLGLAANPLLKYASDNRDPDPPAFPANADELELDMYPIDLSAATPEQILQEQKTKLFSDLGFPLP